jgi:hypothetical protein
MSGELHSTLGHIKYSRWFIQSYVNIFASLEKLLSKRHKIPLDTLEIQEALDSLKENIVTMSERA